MDNTLLLLVLISAATFGTIYVSSWLGMANYSNDIVVERRLSTNRDMQVVGRAFPLIVGAAMICVSATIWGGENSAGLILVLLPLFGLVAWKTIVGVSSNE